jgi:hypothetical protein
MLQDMPLEALSDRPLPLHSPDGDLGDFFGFAECSVYVPPQAPLGDTPLLPARDPDTHTLHYPSGVTVRGVYFSEELKLFKRLGYTVVAHQGIQFRRSPSPFKDYVRDMYERKVTATSEAERSVYKLLLNGLYGYFGRKTPDRVTRVLSTTELLDKDVLLRYPTYTTTHTPNGYSIIDRALKPAPFIPVKTRATMEGYHSNRPSPPGNIAVAAAITAYGRITMAQYKTLPGNPALYSDTDSVHLTFPLDPKYVGTEIGMMKLEAVAEELCLVRNKVYAYKTIEGKVVVRAAGVTRGDVSIEQIRALVENPDKPIHFTSSIITAVGHQLFERRRSVTLQP